MSTDLSFGIIPFRDTENGREVLLIQHRRDRFWGFPKGHLEEGEEPIQGASRELFEETNLTVDQLLCKEPFIEHYQFEHQEQVIEKTVTYFAAHVTGEIKVQDEEILQARWCPVDQAFELLTYDEAKQLLQSTLTKIS